jgi:hypothetical protein
MRNLSTRKRETEAASRLRLHPFAGREEVPAVVLREGPPEAVRTVGARPLPALGSPEPFDVPRAPNRRDPAGGVAGDARADARRRESGPNEPPTAPGRRFAATQSWSPSGQSRRTRPASFKRPTASATVGFVIIAERQTAGSASTHPKNRSIRAAPSGSGTGAPFAGGAPPAARVASASATRRTSGGAAVLEGARSSPQGQRRRPGRLQVSLRAQAEQASVRRVPWRGQATKPCTSQTGATGRPSATQSTQTRGPRREQVRRHGRVRREAQQPGSGRVGPGRGQRERVGVDQPADERGKGRPNRTGVWRRPEPAAASRFRR